MYVELNKILEFALYIYFFYSVKYVKNEKLTFALQLLN